MSWMFCRCGLLETLPDISKWNTKKVTDMSGMFFKCSLLISLPDISKWTINDELEKNDMFEGCNELIIPEKFKESNCLIS